jgi:hypothetical protein
MLDERQRRILCSELFLWTSSCGDLALALRAAPIFVEFGEFQERWYCGTIARTLEILVQVIAEKNRGRDMTGWQRKLMETIISSDIDTEWRQIWAYIPYLITILTRANLRRKKRPSARYFWLICRFLSAISKEFGLLFATVVDSIAEHLKKGVDLSKISSVKFPGILANFVTLETSIIDPKCLPDSIDTLCWSIATIATTAPPAIIVKNADNEDQANAAVLLLIIPYVATVCQESLLERLKAKFSGGIQVVFDHFHESAPFEEFKEFIRALLRPFGP